MKLLVWLLKLLDTRMTTPVMYGPFHLAFFALSIALAVLLYKKHKTPDQRFIGRLLLITSLVVIFFEVLKQINFTFSYDGNTIKADYQWYAFPFQFCSTPMYAGLVAAILKKGKVHDAICAYLATYAVFGGLVVMLYPPQVFINVIAINLQTMICHGAMITVGVYLLSVRYVALRHKTILSATAVFCVFLLIAIASNELVHISGIAGDETFNMFYISPHAAPSLPVYSIVQEMVPYPYCLFIYVFIFALAAYVILLCAMLFRRIWLQAACKNTTSAQI